MHQYRFQKGKSAVEALQTVMETANGFKTGWCPLIRIDIRNAFNLARHILIVQKLQGRKMLDYLITFVKNNLTGRKIMLDHKQTQETNMRVPQGSVLGPTLWNILYDSR